MRRGATITSDHGVSPVVGMIMILAISVTGIAAVVAWGLPAVDEMKATVEARAVTNQFKELDHDVKQLVSGTADRTAKRWQPSLSRGSIDFVESSERWVLGYATCYGGTITSETNCDEADEYSWSLRGVADTDDVFALRNSGSAAVALYVSAAVLDNGAETALCVWDPSTGAAISTSGVTVNAGSEKTLNLRVSGCATAKNIETSTNPGDVFRFEITATNALGTSDDKPAGAFFVYDAGEARFTLDTTGTRKTVFLSNGAIIVGNGGVEVIDNTPGIPPPKDTPDGWHFFVRGAAFQGSASFAGESRFDILLSLYGTTTLAEETAGELYVYVGGSHQAAWENHLSDSNGYDLAADAAVTDMTALKQRVEEGGDYQPVTFTFVHSVVRVEQ